MTKTIFEEERDLARKTKRCMGCDSPIKTYHVRWSVLCGDPACEQYYHSLYDSQPEVSARRKAAAKLYAIKNKEKIAAKARERYYKQRGYLPRKNDL